jgi:polyisoprenoid-binding protein YceI
MPVLGKERSFGRWHRALRHIGHVQVLDTCRQPITRCVRIAEQAAAAVNRGGATLAIRVESPARISMPLRFSCLLALLWVGPAAAATRTFSIDSNTSIVHIHVGKTGIASFAGGHEHEIIARSLQGEVAADFEDLSRSSVELTFDAKSLAVIPQGEPEGDAQKVEQAMKGPDVLDVARFPTIRFRSRLVSGKQRSPGAYELRVVGDLSLHGVENPIVVPLQLELRGGALTGTGKVVVKQSDYAIEPPSAAGGLVKADDEVTVTFRIAAREGA